MVIYQMQVISLRYLLKTKRRLIRRTSLSGEKVALESCMKSPPLRAGWALDKVERARMIAEAEEASLKVCKEQVAAAESTIPSSPELIEADERAAIRTAAIWVANYPNGNLAKADLAYQKEWILQRVLIWREANPDDKENFCPTNVVWNADDNCVARIIKDLQANDNPEPKIESGYSRIEAKLREDAYQREANRHKFEHHQTITSFRFRNQVKSH